MIFVFNFLNYIQLTKIHKYEVAFGKYSRVTLLIEILLAHLRLPNTMFGSLTKKTFNIIKTSRSLSIYIITMKQQHVHVFFSSRYGKGPNLYTFPPEMLGFPDS